MQLHQRNGRFELVSSFEERHVPKAAGFRWDPTARLWWTSEPAKALALREHATDGATQALDAFLAAGGRALEPEQQPERPVLAYADGRWVWRSSIEFKDLAKDAGFRWDPNARLWWTKDVASAAKLAEYASEADAARLENHREEVERALAASRATDAEVEIPAPAGQEYLPFQKAGIAYALRREGVLIGDEMGLGKTVQALGVINADPRIRRVLVVCPASLRLNWQREAERWLVRPHRALIAASQPEAGFVNAFEQLTRGEGGRLTPGAGGVAVLIINYDIMKNWAATLRGFNWDCLVVDEAHYLKNPKAQRTKMVLGAKRRGGGWEVEPLRARRRLFLTGTAIVNRPVELHGLAASLAPEVFGDFFRFAKRYCAAYQTGYGWDFSGASHLDELQDRLRAACMVRRLKADVLAELPAKRRQVIELPANGASGAVRAEATAWAATQERIAGLRAAVEIARVCGTKAEHERAVEALRSGQSAAFNELSKLRHQTAIAKVPYVADHTRELVEQVGKVVLFAHHKDVVEQLRAALADLGVVTVTGDTPMQARQEAVDRFQADPAVRVFIGNIQAAGVGLTLTAAAHVVFAELDWVPGNISQAEDRCHRIGQVNSVLVQHLVLEGSLDAHIARVLVDKQKVLDAALDDDTRGAREQAAAAELARREEIERRAAELVAQRAATRLTLDEAKALAAEEVAEREKRLAATRQEAKRGFDLGDKPSTADIRVESMAAAAAELTAEQIAAVHEGLRFLAAYDADRARDRNDIGYSRPDSYIGHWLAGLPALEPRQAALGRELLRRYRNTQLPAELVERLG